MTGVLRTRKVYTGDLRTSTIPGKSESNNPVFDSVLVEPGPKSTLRSNGEPGTSHEQTHWEFVVENTCQIYPEVILEVA